MMIEDDHAISEVDFRSETRAGVGLFCAGFEDRARAYANRLVRARTNFDATVVLRYRNKSRANEASFSRVFERVSRLSAQEPVVADIDGHRPQQTYIAVCKALCSAGRKADRKSAVVDVSGMTHLVAVSSIHASLRFTPNVTVIYTEAMNYFPRRRDEKKLLKAWREYSFHEAEEYLQSAALRSIDILPEFQGNFRPGRPTCLIVFAGYEPHRMQGLVNVYAPGALIVLFGRSPHGQLSWRTKLSRNLHDELFSGWRLRETEVSTLLPSKVLRKLDSEYTAIRSAYDVAVTPHCSKVQGVAAYAFWRRHPETQLVFTTPVQFHPDRYSTKSRKTYEIDMARLLE